MINLKIENVRSQEAAEQLLSRRKKVWDSTKVGDLFGSLVYVNEGIEVAIWRKIDSQIEIFFEKKAK